MISKDVLVLNELDRLGFYSYADIKQRQVLAQNQQTQASYPLYDQFNRNVNPSMLAGVRNWSQIRSKIQPLIQFLSRYGETLNSFIRKMHVLAKYSLIGGNIDFLQTPTQYDSIKNVIKGIQGNPQLSSEVDLFLKNFPQLYRDIQGANGVYLSSLGKNYFDWFINTKSVDEFKAVTQQLKSARQIAVQVARSGGGLYDISKLSQLSSIEMQQVLGGLQADRKLEQFRRYAKQFLKLKGIDASQKTDQQLLNLLSRHQRSTYQRPITTPTKLVNQWIAQGDEAKLEQFRQYAKRFLRLKGIDASQKTDQQLLNLFNRHQRPVYQRPITNAKLVNQLIAQSDDAKNLLSSSGAVLNTTDDGIKAAKILSTKIPALVKWLGVVGVIFSLPAAVTWTNRIINNQVDWGDANVRAEFVQDLTSLASAVTFMIPGAQGFSLALAAISLGIMGGKAAINTVVKPNSADEKIIGTYKPQSAQDQGHYEHGQYMIKALLDEVTPGQTTNFNNWMGSRNPQYDFRNTKLRDLVTEINTFVKQPQYAKTYSWYSTPTNENKWMSVEFNEKLMNLKKLVQSRGEATGTTQFNNLDDILNHIKKTYPGRLDSFTTLRDLMTNPTWSGWFKNVPKNLTDVQLVQWFNANPTIKEWAY